MRTLAAQLSSVSILILCNDLQDWLIIYLIVTISETKSSSIFISFLQGKYFTPDTGARLTEFDNFIFSILTSILIHNLEKKIII